MKALIAAILLFGTGGCAAEMLAGFEESAPFDEQILGETRDGVRIVINAPGAHRFDARKPTLLILYALPNGNTIEQTAGAQLAEGVDWHFDIQHIAAQTRLLREFDPNQNVVVAYLEAEGRSWSTWRKKHPQHETIIRAILESVARKVPGNPLRIALCAHSGGGSFIFGYLNGGELIPDRIERIIFLDANYAYSDEEHHGEKLLSWLAASPRHRLIVMAYDDRNIELGGKRVVSDTGGTWRATQRMIDQLSHKMKFERSTTAGFERFCSLDGRLTFLLHPNPQNKILHTTIVGEWNGFIHAMTLGTPAEEKWGKFGGERAFSKYIQPASAPATSPSNQIPPRRADAIGGKAFIQQIAQLSLAQREDEIVRQIASGNVPSFLRRLKKIRVKATGIEGVEHIAEYEVMPDYLAIGSDDDFVRVPMTPIAAQKIADLLDCSLPTRKMVDDIYAQAEVKLEPQPLSEKREAVETFIQHSEMIESQLIGKARGALIAGIKKDIVISNRLKEKPNRVAIYGWHKLDGRAIQPLSIIHKNTYVDYSHGVRLVCRRMTVDEKEMPMADVLGDPHRCALISDEGTIDSTNYQP